MTKRFPCWTWIYCQNSSIRKLSNSLKTNAFLICHLKILELFFEKMFDRYIKILEEIKFCDLHFIKWEKLQEKYILFSLFWAVTPKGEKGHNHNKGPNHILSFRLEAAAQDHEKSFRSIILPFLGNIKNFIQLKYFSKQTRK